MFIIRIQIEWDSSGSKKKLIGKLPRLVSFKGRRKLFGAIFIIAGFLLLSFSPIYKYFASRGFSLDYMSVLGANQEVAQENIQSFDEGPIKIESELLDGVIDEKLFPERIIIPSTGIDIRVKGANVVDGKWEIFEDRASYGIGSAMPGFIGNSVLFAHAREGYFLTLKDIKLDSQIYIMTPQDWFTYKVSEIKEVLPNDISVIKETTDETLTLYTCSGFLDSKRLIVIAKRV